MSRVLICLLLLLSAAPAFAARPDPVVDLEHWDRRPVAAGLPVRAVIGHPVVDASGRNVGTAADILFGVNSQAVVLLVGAGSGQTAAYDWRRVRVTPGEQSVQVTGTGPDTIHLPPRDTGPHARPFYATELLGDRARADDMRSFGIIHDAVIAPNGRLVAIVVQLFHIGRTGAPSGSFPFPFYGYDLPFRPATGFYVLPYNEDLLFRYATRYPQLDIAGGPTGF